ncbi:MAG: CBS domain-containing protein [Candidatus Melainabacteria bacterium HGW-Melainabacteria-1]|nr:MAG: CBS domain-containing protein [Candidatus Melainabacteria bacterium HGW-Melainabacteria-1]
MTQNTCVVEQGTEVVTVAKLMLENDIGAIPVVQDGKAIGIITDRDIVTRSLAKGEDPIGHHVEDYMTPSIVSVRENAPLQECLDLMEQHQIRRMLVVDEQGKLCGIVAQADIAREASTENTAELLEKVSA